MTLSKLHQTILVVLVLVLVGLGFWWFAQMQGKAPAPAAIEPASGPSVQTSLVSVSTSTPSAHTSTSSSKRILPTISPKDTIVSWSYDGFLNDNGTREAAALKQIADLKKKLMGGADDYQLYIGIAQIYDHLGDGKSAYENLSRAIEVDSATTTTGTAWNNVGVLMERIGAYNTARAAFDRAVAIQPGIHSFQISRVELMIYHFSKDIAGVEAAFKDAEAVLGAGDPQLLDLRNRWKSQS